jgi:hypothetical protein
MPPQRCSEKFRFALLLLCHAAPVCVRGFVRHNVARAGAVGSRTLGLRRERWVMATDGSNSSAMRDPELNPMLRRVWGVKTKDANERPHSDGRDSLPFLLKSLGPPEKELGTYPLDPLTNCGDSLFVGETRYVVKSTTLVYKLESGKYRMVGKQAALKEKSRISAEEALTRMYLAEFTPPRPESES